VRVVYEIGEFQVDAQRRLLFLGGEPRPLPLASKAFDTLLYLIEHRDRLLDKDTLLAAIWPDVVVGENNLNQVITSLRRVLGERRDEHRFIVTVPGRGYRFVADVRERSAGSPTSKIHHMAVADPLSKRAGPVAQRTSIAVLPFANLTGEPGRDYLGDGMSEELIHKLTRVPGFRVSARTSSFAYKGKNVHIRDIARDLNVTAVLEGSIRMTANRIRVTAQLVDAQSGFHVWSKTYEQALDDIFKLQDELAAAIVGALQGERDIASMLPIISTHPTTDVEAYQLYLQGISLYAHLSEANLRTAIQRFQQALTRDPTFTRAICAVALAHITTGVYGWEPLADSLKHAQRYGERALARDSRLGDARTVLGMVSACRGDWLAAESHFRSALELDCDATTNIQYATYILSATGHQQKAIREAERAYQAAPASSWTLLILACLHSFAGRDEEALRYADFAVGQGWLVDVVPVPLIRAQAAQRSGRYPEAAQNMIKALPPQVRSAGGEELVRLIYTALAEREQSPAAIAAISRLMSERTAQTVNTLHLPMLLLHWTVVLGDFDLAFLIANRTLDQFELQGAIPVIDFLSQLWLPELRAFRQDLRFQVFATRLGLMEYWQQYGSPDDCEVKDGKLICHYNA
jgi:TolB-like protein